jgi:hypothetical protein
MTEPDAKLKSEKVSFLRSPWSTKLPKFNKFKRRQPEILSNHLPPPALLLLFELNLVGLLTAL